MPRAIVDCKLSYDIYDADVRLCGDYTVHCRFADRPYWLPHGAGVEARATGVSYPAGVAAGPSTRFHGDDRGEARRGHRFPEHARRDGSRPDSGARSRSRDAAIAHRGNTATGTTRRGILANAGINSATRSA